MAKEYMQINLTYEELSLIHTLIMMLSMAEPKLMKRNVRDLDNKVISALQELTK